MITTKIELTKIEASDGMILYNGEAIGNVIFLGTGDNAENWREITDEEAQAIMKEKEAELKAQAGIL